MGEWGKKRERERKRKGEKKGETKKSLMSTWCEQSHKIDKSCKKIFFYFDIKHESKKNHEVTNLMLSKRS